MKKPVILYVEDDETLLFITSENLEREGFEVITARQGMEAWKLFREAQPDICVLDVMLPKLDGFSLARKIREINEDVPILFVTAKSLKEDKLEGLLLGGDDYLVKPFSLEELVLKIRVFLKRSIANPGAVSRDLVPFGHFSFDRRNLMVHAPDKKQKLTYREADLLNLFLSKQGVLISREQILEQLWGGNDYFAGRSLDVFISRLRKYLKSDPRVRIENRHGVGFVLTVED